MTLYERIKQRLLNNKLVVFLVIGFIVISAVFDLWGKVAELIPKGDNGKTHSSTHSPYTIYGGIEISQRNGKIDTVGRWCEYKGRFKDINMLFTVSEGINEKYSKVDCIFEETPKITCKHETIKENKHIYIADRFYITDETTDTKRVLITFVGDENNAPRCSLAFEGVIQNGKLEGDLTWKRIDQSRHPKLSFTVRHKISKML